MLDKHRKRITPRGIKNEGLVRGYRAQRVSARNRPRAGAAIKGRIFADVGGVCSFKNSFSASAIGCGRPARRTLLGPFRSWKYPSSLRSSRV